MHDLCRWLAGGRRGAGSVRQIELEGGVERWTAFQVAGEGRGKAANMFGD